MAGRSPDGHGWLRCGPFEIDLRAGELRKQGLKVRIQEQPFRVLSALLERPGEIVTREELRQQLWPQDVFVDFDQGLNHAVRKLRRALGDDAGSPRFLETIARRGYRLLVRVENEHRETAPVRREPRRNVPRLVVGLLLLSLFPIGASPLVRSRGGGASEASATQIRLVVLPFDNLTGDPAQQYVADGVSEETTTQLGLLHPEGLDVIARATAAGYHGVDKNPREVGKQLGVDYILYGCVRGSSKRVRVNVQLVRVRDEVQVWTGSYDRELEDALRLQIELGQSIARRLPIELTGAETASAPRRPRPNRTG